MIKIPDDGILYHGSYTEVVEINLSCCRKGLDFGKGFYLTSSFQQAVSYIPASVRKAIRRGILPQNFEEADGKVSVFKFERISGLSVHCFEEADEEWLHFVACNRNSDLFPKMRSKFAMIDVIGGKVADDLTAITLNNYVAGVFGEVGSKRADRTALELLEPERLTDQFCFRTPKALKALKFIRSERYGDIIKH